MPGSFFHLKPKTYEKSPKCSVTVFCENPKAISALRISSASCSIVGLFVGIVIRTFFPCDLIVIVVLLLLCIVLLFCFNPITYQRLQSFGAYFAAKISGFE